MRGVKLHGEAVRPLGGRWSQVQRRCKAAFGQLGAAPSPRVRPPAAERRRATRAASWRSATSTARQYTCTTYAGGPRCTRRVAADEPSCMTHPAAPPVRPVSPFVPNLPGSQRLVPSTRIPRQFFPIRSGSDDAIASVSSHAAPVTAMRYCAATDVVVSTDEKGARAATGVRGPRRGGRGVAEPSWCRPLVLAQRTSMPASHSTHSIHNATQTQHGTTHASSPRLDQASERQHPPLATPTPRRTPWRPARAPRASSPSPRFFNYTHT